MDEEKSYYKRGILTARGHISSKGEAGWFLVNLVDQLNEIIFALTARGHISSKEEAGWFLVNLADQLTKLYLH